MESGESTSTSRIWTRHTRWLIPFALHQFDGCFYKEAWIAEFHRHLLRLQSDPNIPKWPGKDCLHLLLQSNAVRTQESRSHLPALHQQDVFPADRKDNEVYIDDMLVKSLKIVQHLEHLDQPFDIMRKYNINLTATKCTFGVPSGKFLGYMITQQWIWANP